jgi:tRNA pseudouridine38-40 synthase
MRVKITIAYDGTGLRGWQRQPDAETVQGILEELVGRVGNAPTRVHGASRTDAGVHAEGQVAHFDAPDHRAPEEWQRALNALLPATIRIVGAEHADPEFHARHAAAGKTYRYRLDTSPIASPFLARWCWHVPAELDLAAVEAGAEALRGPLLDQRAFATRPEPGREHRPLHDLTIERGPELEFRFTGRSFLRFAVRGMVGALVAAGRGQLTADQIADLARSGDRARAPAPAPPHGLCLVRVHYRPPGDLPEPTG